MADGTTNTRHLGATAITLIHDPSASDSSASNPPLPDWNVSVGELEVEEQ